MTEERAFTLNRRFVKKLCGRLSKPNTFGFRFEPSETPTVDQMGEIISAAMWASTQYEEGRLSRFKVAFGEPFILDHLSLIFEAPKPWSVEELRKLSPAINPLDGHIGVWPTGPQGELQIWGLLTNSMLQLTFEVIDPGRITVSTIPNHKVAEIRGHRADFVSQDWNSDALDLLSPPDTDICRTTVAVAKQYLLMYATQEMLRQMRLLGHGGAILFVSDSNRWVKSVEYPIYACSQKLNKITPLNLAFGKEVSRIAQDETSFDGGRVKSCFELFSERYKPWVEDAARSIGYLTAIDGATVLNKEFKVLGFGVKLRGSQKTSNQETVTVISPLERDLVRKELPLAEEFRGTRHLSVARFVLKNPGSLALVVSQDGGITGLVMSKIDREKPEPKLLAYRGLELLV